MKLLKANLTYIKYYEEHNVKLNQGVDIIKDIMKYPIEVFKHQISKTQRYGAGGNLYKEKLYSVVKDKKQL